MRIAQYPMSVILRATKPDECTFDINMPEGAQLVRVDQINNQPVLWALIDGSRPRVPRTIVVRGNGRELPELTTDGKPDGRTLRYVDTATWGQGAHIYHIFEIVVPAASVGDEPEPPAAGDAGSKEKPDEKSQQTA